MRTQRGGKAEAGQVLVAVVVLLVILAILAPLMVFYAQRESIWTAKQARNTRAFNLAEAGIEKGYLAISLSTTTWKNLQNGQQLADYKFDKTYSDVPGGTYTLSISSGPGSQQVTIISVGRDDLQQELRAIEAIYYSAGITSGLYANGITASGGVTIQWGSMLSRGSISLSGSANQCYPQKYAMGGISTSGSSACHGTWSATQTPCTDNVEWWAYNCPPGLPPAPSFDLAAYKSQAQAATGCPSGGTPSGSCYYTSDKSFSNFVMTSSKTIYCEEDLSVSNGFLWGDVIVLGDLSFSGGGKGAYSIPDAYTPDGIPSNAWKQYQKIDTSATAEYYGDAGYHQVNSSFQFGMNGNPSMQIGTKDSPSARGFVYAGGNFSASGGTSVHGIVYSPNGISTGSGGFTIYYDADVASNVKLVSSVPTRVWWQDLVYSSWPGP